MSSLGVRICICPQNEYSVRIPINPGKFLKVNDGNERLETNQNVRKNDSGSQSDGEFSGVTSVTGF